MTKMSDLQKKDLEYIFHPCSQMKDYEDLPPIVITEGKGLYLKDEFGNTYMDCVSSWWVNLFGHSNDRINKVLYDQAKSLEHVIFANFTHKPAIELGELLTEVVPKGLTKLFFTDNGASSIEVSLKLSFQYYQQAGFTKKKKFISLANGYHGETIGALAVGDVDIFTETYRPLIKESIKVQGPNCFNCPYKLNFENCDAECFIHMENALETHHEEIAAVVVEPLVQGVAGMRIYSPKYLIKLRELTKKLNVHFIADEIAVGFGRTGKMFACEHAGISPDIMCIGKGLTAGYFPMSIVLMTEDIYKAFYADYFEGKSFLHSHSYSGNPLGCRLAVETLKIFKEENILQTIEKKGNYLRNKAIQLFKNHPNIGEYRQIGLIGAFEFVKNKETKELFPATDRVGYEIYKIALKKGALLRPLGNIIYFMPPYIITEEEIDKMLEICKESVEEYLAQRNK
ncbi:MAG: adenosylmethionine--8-amino-7-oxononanoate transaminase [Cetobacterium sp.]